jgi:hypothetical protein
MWRQRTCQANWRLVNCKIGLQTLRGHGSVFAGMADERRTMVQTVASAEEIIMSAQAKQNLKDTLAKITQGLNQGSRARSRVRGGESGLDMGLVFLHYSSIAPI